MPRITFQPAGVTIEVPPGTTVFQAAARADVSIPSQCGGKCACALCRVQVEVGDDRVSPMRWEEEAHMGNVFFLTRERLSCQLQVFGDVTIVVPEARVKDGKKGRYTPLSIIRKREQMEREEELRRVRGEERSGRRGPGRGPPRAAGPVAPPVADPGATDADVGAPGAPPGPTGLGHMGGDDAVGGASPTAARPPGASDARRRRRRRPGRAPEGGEPRGG